MNTGRLITPEYPWRAPQPPATPVEPLDDSQVLHGPSFLGLSDDGSADSKYLLDEEEPHGHAKLYLAVVILLILAALGYFQWRQGGLDTAQIKTTLQGLEQKWLGKTASAQAAPAPAVAESPAAVTPNTPSPNSASAGSNTDPGAGATTPIPTDTTSGAQNGSGPPANTIPGSANAAPPAATKADGGAPAAKTSSSNAASPDNSAKAVPADEAESGAVSADTQPSKPVRPDQRAAADAEAEANNDALINAADNYLYGRGVPRDCDRAISNLRQAADESSKAMSKLGGLYATGNCVPRDLPTAYHWFALALREDRKNSYVEHDLQIMWNQMSPEEKQRAIHMSQ